MSRKTMRYRWLVIAWFLGSSMLCFAASKQGDKQKPFFVGAARACAELETERLAEIKERHSDSILILPGVIGMGIGLDREQRQLVFLVDVDEGMPTPPLPDTIEDVPVMVERIPRYVNLHGGADCDPCHAEALPPLVPMGNSMTVENNGFCTLGFVACDVVRDEIVLVTNAHCAPGDDGCPAGEPIGAEVFHPSFDHPDALEVGTVGGHASICGPDAVDATKVDADGTMISVRIRDIGFPSAAPGEVLLGDPVQKSGRRTGHTFGTVSAVRYDLDIVECPTCLASFTDLIRVHADDGSFLDLSDSGSALVTADGRPQIVGLLFATADGVWAVANTITQVLEALDLSLDVTDCLCAAEAAVGGGADATDSLTLLRRFRDDVLQQTPRGKGYASQYSEFAGEVALLLMADEDLRLRTQGTWSRLKSVFKGIVAQGSALITRSELRELRQLIAAFAARGSKGLRRALHDLRRDLADEAVLEEFGVSVSDSPSAGEPRPPCFAPAP